MTNPTPEEILQQMGLSSEQIEQHLEEEKIKPSDRTICLCGHPKNRHFIDVDFSTCRPSRMNCACAKFIPIAKVQDSRDFLRKTEGHGIDHALVKGIFNATQRNHYFEWNKENYICMRCKTSGDEKQLTIFPFEGDPQQGLRRTIQYDFARWNFFLCDDCQEEM